MGLDARLVSFDFACLPVLCLFRFIFLPQQNHVMIIFCELKKIWEERRKTMETHRRASSFLPINLLKINTFRFDSIETRWG